MEIITSYVFDIIPYFYLYSIPIIWNFCHGQLAPFIMRMKKGGRRGTYTTWNAIQQLKIPTRKKQSTRQTVFLHGDGHILLLPGTAFDLEDEEAERLFVSAHSKGCLIQGSLIL